MFCNCKDCSNSLSDEPFIYSCEKCKNFYCNPCAEKSKSYWDVMNVACLYSLKLCNLCICGTKNDRIQKKTSKIIQHFFY